MGDDSTATAPTTGSRTIIRVAERRRFLVVDKRSIEDRRLSLRAKGLLAYILTKPDDWTIDSTRLATEVDEGRDAIRKAMNELEAAGYLTRHRSQGPRGRWIHEVVIHEIPVRKTAGGTDDGKPGVGDPGVGRPGAGKPGVKDLNTQLEEKPLAATAASESVETDEQEQKPAAKEEPRAPRARDPLWDAFVAERLPEPQTKSERGRWNAAIKQLRDIEATPGDVRTRCREYKRRWQGIEITPTAIAANWTTLGIRQEGSRYGAPAGPEGPRCTHGYAMAEDDDGWSSACTTCDGQVLERAAATWRREQHEGAA